LLIAVGVWAVYTYMVAPGGVVVTLAEQNDSGETGSAVIDEVDGALRVTLDMQGQPAGVAQPAHIHSGTCAELGGVVYPLTSPTDGGSVTDVAVSLAELQAGGPVAVNIHKSGAEAQIYVACGNINF